jgi:hypothetical protein
MRLGHVHAQRDVRQAGELAVGLGNRHNLGAVALGDRDRADHIGGFSGRRDGDDHVALAQGRRHHAHQVRIGGVGHRHAEAEEAMLDLRDDHGGSAPHAEGNEFAAGGDRRRGSLDVLAPELLLGGGNGAPNFLEDRTPHCRLRELGAGERRRLDIDAANDHALGELDLEFAQTPAPDRARKARDGRLADAGSPREIAAARVHRKGDIGKDGARHALLGRTQPRHRLPDGGNDVVGAHEGGSRHGRRLGGVGGGFTFGGGGQF